jgi:type II secretory ATPase GspE/PulE/Tfp pilus assembly ATPase PilB-like protein
MVRAYDGDFDKLNIAYHDDLTLFRAKGCQKCQNTGYRGRAGLHEILVGTPGLKILIQSKAPIGEIKKEAIADGMTTLMQEGIRKVFLGLTDMTQVRKVCL